MKAVRTAKWGYIIVSVIFCILGTLFISFPEISAETVCRIMGIFLIVCGIIKIIGYFSKDLYCLAFQFDLALGLMSLTIGSVMLFHTGKVVPFLQFVIGIIIFLDGLFKLQIAFDAGKFGLVRWWVIMVASVIVCIFGLLLIINPFKGTVIIMVMTGITLLSEGILNLCVAVYTVRYLKKKKTEKLTFDS